MNCPLPKNAMFSKDPKGIIKIRASDSVVIIEYRDNKAVILAFNFKTSKTGRTKTFF